MKIVFDNDFKADSHKSFYLLPYVLFKVCWSNYFIQLAIGWIGFRITFKFKEKI